MPIAFDATTAGQNAFATTLTFAHTCSGSDRLLVVAVGASSEISGVTYNGVAMTAVESGDLFRQLFTLVAPATGANDVVVTLTGPNAIVARAVSYTGVAQAGAVSGVQAAATGDGEPSVTVSSAVGSLVVGMSAIGDNSGLTPPVHTVGAAQTDRGEVIQDGQYLIVSDEAGAASVAHSYTRSGAFYYGQRVVAVSLGEASGGGGGGGGPTIARRGFTIRPVRRG